MSFTETDLKKVAQLAALELKPENIAPLAAELNKILGLIDQIQAIDTTGIEPLSHPLNLVQNLREDLVTESDERKDFQALCANCEDAHYLVPTVIQE
jgi:aspartyl-tRNA(Asn)/glutamyl-tRNA(Gln) amidotransferase subunit C